MSNEIRNKRILALAGQKSYGLIAEELGITRCVVAGVIFRDKYPARHRECSPNSGGSPNKIGEGHHGTGRYAEQVLSRCPPAGSRA
jgi:hypothetical protein